MYSGKLQLPKVSIPSAILRKLNKTFLDDLVQAATMKEMPLCFNLNCNHAGIKIVPNSSYSLEQEKASRVEVIGLTDKCLITAVFCGIFTGDFLPVQIVSLSMIALNDISRNQQRLYDIPPLKNDGTCNCIFFKYWP